MVGLKEKRMVDGMVGLRDDAKVGNWVLRMVDTMVELLETTMVGT